MSAEPISRAFLRWDKKAPAPAGGQKGGSSSVWATAMKSGP